MKDFKDLSDESQLLKAQLREELKKTEKLATDLKKNIDIENIKESTRRIRAISTYQTHLENVISGINHEVAPWLGSIYNISCASKKELEKIDCPFEGSCEKTSEIKKLKKYMIEKIDKISHASKQAIGVLRVISSSVKRLQSYSTRISNLGDTILSWLNFTLLDNTIKEKLTCENIDIKYETLNFDVNHSPMLLSQIILNLVSNSIDHNTDRLDTLKIVIQGNEKRKVLLYSDNGKGIKKEIIERLFSCGNTSKELNIHSTHGLGLSMCMDYCISMGARIWASSEENKGVTFIIQFESESECLTPIPETRNQAKESDKFYINGLSNIEHIYEKRKTDLDLIKELNKKK